MNKKTTLQTAEILAGSATDENLKKRYGTSVNEYMSREHAKEVRNQINILRGEFEKFGKSKTSPLSLEELHDFLIKINVKKIIIIYKFNYIFNYIANGKRN